MDPVLQIGENDILDNPGFEGEYVGGIAPGDWYFVGTGTPSEETTLPWKSSGVSAQRVDNDTRYNNTVFGQTVMPNLVHRQTYQFKYKIHVLSGFAQIRIAMWTPWQLSLVIDFNAADGPVEGTIYFSSYAGATGALQLRNTGTTTPLSCIIDDWEIKPIENDTHIFIYPLGYDRGAFDSDGYEYPGTGVGGGYNFNRQGQLDAGNDVTMFSLYHPGTRSYTMQGFWATITGFDERSIWQREYSSKPEGLVSIDGVGYAKYQGAGVEPHGLQKVAWINEYQSSGAEEIRINQTDYATSYTLGSHRAGLFQGAPYAHACFPGPNITPTGVTAAKFETLGFFDRILDTKERAYLENLLYNMR